MKTGASIGPTPHCDAMCSCITTMDTQCRPTFRLHCRVWVIDWQSRQGYKVLVVMAPFEH